MLREIEKAVEALKAVPAEYHELVLAEAKGKARKKPGPKPGTVKRKKPGPKPGFKKVKKENVPVKVDEEKLEKLKKLRAKSE